MTNRFQKGRYKVVEGNFGKNRGFIAAVSLNAVWVVHAMAYSEIFPLWACRPKMYGGIAFTTSEVANVLALSGTSMLLFQLFFFPRLIRAFGTIECLQAFMFLTVPFTAIYPLIARFHGMVLWILLVLVSVGKNVISSANFTETFILVNNSVVKAQRGIANGFSTSVMSFFQAIGPACAGALFSWSEEREDASFLPVSQPTDPIANGTSFFYQQLRSGL
ncbi:hypothetical protein L7F22_015445 [Adiantum nelumboides]|nr:hypothetical protein [Adiantum nelumboides]